MMDFYQTALQMEEELFPTLLDFLQIAKQRGLPLTQKEKTQLYTLNAGEIGEQMAINLLQEFGQKDWLVMRNLWIDYSSEYESDIILFTKHKPYLFEVKNYYGKFVYDNGICTIDGKKLDSNPIFQAQKAHTNLQKITHEVFPKIETEGALVFIGEHNEAKFNSEVREIKTKMRNQFRRYIQDIAVEEANHSFNSLDSSKIIAQLERYETTTPFRPTSLQPDDLKNARKGIHCIKCGRYNTQVYKRYIECVDCKFKESREEAVFRTICEFGVLTFGHHEMKRSDLSAFMNHQVSKGYLINFLKTHFKVSGVYKSTTYQSNKLPRYKIQKTFSK